MAVSAFATAAGGLLAGAYILDAATRSSPTPDPHRPLERRADGYVSSKACRACHAREYASWKSSYHQRMTQLPEPATVLGDFDGVSLSIYDRSYRLEQRGQEFWVHAAATDKAEAWSRKLTLVTGAHHFQAYWTATGIGRKLELFPFIFQRAERRWIPFDSLVISPPGLRQVSGEGGEWNRVCIHCHATGPEPRALDLEAIDSQVAELGIGCEACHGPGGQHVEQNQNPLRRYALHLGDRPDPSIVNPARLDPRKSAEVCGQCHAVQDFTRRMLRSWLEDGPSYRPGGDLFEDRVQLTHNIESNYGHTRFWSDGQVRVGGREFSGVLSSPCFQGGNFDCTTCHKLHRASDDPRPVSEWADDQLHAGMRGNSACTQCHGAYEANSALEAHTHHAAGSSGSSCYNCHMPYTAFGLHKATRSHQITNPSVQQSVEAGRPNACNQCHIDRTLSWSADHLEAWWGIPRPELSKTQREVAASVIWALSGEANQRALAAWSLGWEPALAASQNEPHSGAGQSDPDWMILYLAQLLADPYSVVRSVAQRSLVRHPGFEHLEFEDSAMSPAGKAPETRSQGERVVLEWAKRRNPNNRPRPELLFGEGGEIDTARIEQLLAARDNRPIYLAE